MGVSHPRSSLCGHQGLTWRYPGQSIKTLGMLGAENVRPGGHTAVESGFPDNPQRQEIRRGLRPQENLPSCFFSYPFSLPFTLSQGWSRSPSTARRSKRKTPATCKDSWKVIGCYNVPLVKYRYRAEIKSKWILVSMYFLRVIVFRSNG
ncbi:hypothetical protein FKM82_007530 [Ascaphus truei]